MKPRTRLCLAIGSLFVMLVLSPVRVRAACNLIPQTTKTFDSVVGQTNRPFAGPGEPLEVRRRPCDPGSTGFGPSPSDQVVTVLFTPVGSTTRNAVVLTAGSCSAISSQRTACQSQLPGGQVLCVEGTNAGLQVVPRPEGAALRLLFPNTDTLVGSTGDGLTLAGPATIAVTRSTAAQLPCGLASASCATQAASISGLVACVDEFYANDGGCGTNQPHGIFNHFTALPFPNDFSGACIDEAPPCNPTAREFRVTTDQDGNALMPINWSSVLVRPGGVPFPRLLSASLYTPLPVTFPGQSFFASFSPDGGALAPIFVPQFDPSAPPSVLGLFGSADAPYTVLRIARRSDNFQQCHGGVHDGLPCNGPADCPANCAAGANGGQQCTSDAQCPGSTCTAPSPGSCGPTVCVSGSSAGTACTADRFCPGGECGAGIFTLTPLVFAGVGPVVIPRQPGVCASGPNSGAACATFNDCPGSFCLTGGFCQQQTSQMCSAASACSGVPCVDFELTAANPIPLASLAAQATGAFGFSSLEGVDLVDRNGDGDTADAVVTLRDSTTGALQSLGAPAECIGRSTLTATPPPQGRAVVQLSQPPFLFPAVATEGSLVAFLESEPGEGSCDANNNGAVFDSILRVMRLGPTDLTAGMNESADAAPLINAQSAAISNGQVFFRQSEAATAHQQTIRVSVDSAGNQGDQASGMGSGSTNGALSADGRLVAFYSDADNLVPGDTNGVGDVFVYDRVTAVTERISVDSFGVQGNGVSSSPSISTNGRYVAFLSDAKNLVGDGQGWNDIYVRDRLTGTTERVTVNSAGVKSNNACGHPSISADGRYVAFWSYATNLVPGMTGQQILVHDRQTGANELSSVSSTGVQGDSISEHPSISGDGRSVAFTSYSHNLVPGDTAPSYEVFVHDRQTGLTERVNVSSDGTPGGADSFLPSMSADGRYVAFMSSAALVPGDTNSAYDIFVRDRLTSATERESVSSAGGQGDDQSTNPSISADGRYVAFYSFATNLVPGDTNGQQDVFVHDRLTGATKRVSVDSSGNQGIGAAGNAYTYISAISADGNYVAFMSEASNLVPGDTNGVRDVFLRGPDSTDLAGDLTGDGDVQDTVLALLDTTQPSPSVVSLCPADTVSVAGGAAAFLRPERAGATPNLPACPAGTIVSGGIDLNGNGSATDEVVHLALGGSIVENLGRAATAVSLSGACVGGANVSYPCADNTDCPGGSCAPSVLAALVSESGQDADLNGDGDKLDTVVEVHPAGDGSWANVGQAADAVQVEGTLVALLTPEAAQGNADLNGDGDSVDRILQIYDATAGKLTNSGQAAEEFVMGTQPASCGSGPIIAFRTSEAAQGNTDLNGDGDATDDILQLYVPGVGVVNTRQAVIPCRLPACDPRQPYLVQGDTVKFLTNEADQMQDLNGDGTQADLILQMFDPCKRTLTVAGSVDATAAAAGNPLTNAGTATQTKLTLPTSAGVCVAGNTRLLVPAMCTGDADCPQGVICQPDQPIVAAPAVIPTRLDSVVLAPKPLKVVIPAGRSSVTAVLKVKVRNGNVLPTKAKPGHMIQLAVSDGTCPAGTVAGLPDFDPRTAGAQDSVLLKGGAVKAVKVPLTVNRSAFPTTSQVAPLRCALAVTVKAAGMEDNIDPTAANNTAVVELNVIDQNNSQTYTPGDAVVASIAPVRLTIARQAATSSKISTIPVQVINAGSTSASLTVTASDGTCPTGTVHTQGPATIDVAGGQKGRVNLQVAASNAAFLTANRASPSRCTAVVSVSGPGTDPDPTNNTTQFVIEVTDQEDF